MLVGLFKFSIYQIPPSGHTLCRARQLHEQVTLRSLKPRGRHRRAGTVRRVGALRHQWPLRAAGFKRPTLFFFPFLFWQFSNYEYKEGK